MEEAHIIIEHWSAVLYKDTHKPQVVGLVINHPYIPDGIMATSFVSFIDEAAGLVQTTNSTYRLGTKNPQFDEWLKDRNVWNQTGYKFNAGDTRQAPIILPQLKDMFVDGIVSLYDLANKWLTRDDWRDIHPQVPMSWLNENQQLAFVKEMQMRTAQRMREQS